MTEPGSDQMVRDALGALADRVTVSPDAYHEVRAEWVRRQRRRKRLGIVVASLLVVVADAVGLWALHRSDPGGAVIFDQQAPSAPAEAPSPGSASPELLARIRA